MHAMLSDFFKNFHYFFWNSQQKCWEHHCTGIKNASCQQSWKCIRYYINKITLWVFRLFGCLHGSGRRGDHVISFQFDWAISANSFLFTWRLPYDLLSSSSMWLSRNMIIVRNVGKWAGSPGKRRKGSDPSSFSKQGNIGITSSLTIKATEL